MGTEEFLALVTPAKGYKYIFLNRVESGGGRHVPYTSAEDGALLVEKYLLSTTHTTFFSCASFTEEFLSDGTCWPNGNLKKSFRTQSNCRAVKAFWVDLDCGEDKPYATQELAYNDLARFLKATGLPTPLVVNSGFGLHCYWPLREELPVLRWKETAAVFRAVLDYFSLKHDPSRTTDACSVLRPVGSFNRKRGKPRRVKALNSVKPRKFETFSAKLNNLVDEHNITVTLPRLANPYVGMNSDLMLPPREYPPASAFQVAEKCQQIKMFQATKGDLEEPLWYAGLGLLKFTSEGAQVCHDWSEGHPNYSAEETERKIEQWAFGPSTCARFMHLNPSGCASCPSKGKITTPLQLSVDLKAMHVVEDEAPTAVNDDGTEGPKAFAIQQMPEDLATLYAWRDGSLYMKISSKTTGEEVPTKFCDEFFFPVEHGRGNTQAHETAWMARDAFNHVRTFTIPTEAVGVGGADLLKHLGRNGIVATTGRSKLMTAYINDWFSSLKKRAAEVKACSQFGWQPDWTFVLGDTRYLPGGRTATVRLIGDAMHYADAFVPAGSVEEWTRLMNTTYGYAGQEQYQFLLGAGFGAPLMKLSEGAGGSTVNAYSPDGGEGKSTVALMALGIYGNPAMLKRTKQQTTEKAFYAHCSVMNTLPVLMDETTTMSADAIEHLIYTMSEGKGRSILLPDGTMRKAAAGWSTIALTTANRPFGNTLMASKQNSFALHRRMIEARFHRVTKLTKETADDLMLRSRTVYGVAGPKFVAWLVDNRNEAVEMLIRHKKIFGKRIAARPQDQFMVATAACVLAGVEIANKLGLVTFDLEALTDWLVRRVQNMVTVAEESITRPEDTLGTMLSELQVGVIVTLIEGDGRSHSKAEVIHHPRGGVIHGRYIVEAGRLYIQQNSIRKWCSANQADYNELWRVACERGWVAPSLASYGLGKGTAEYTIGHMKCWQIDWAKMSGEGVVSSPASSLTALKR